MSTTHRGSDRSTDAGVRHCKADAVDDETFEHLVRSTYGMDDYYGLQCRFVLFVCGRLGLRSGEIAHMDESWVDWRRSMICVPAQDRCTKGRDGGICGSCRQALGQMARVRTRQQYDDAHADIGRRDELEPGGGAAVDAVVGESAMETRMWQPKTRAAAREIAFDSVTRADIAIHEFFDQYDAWPHSVQSINRRVDRLAEATDGVTVDGLYPHALRATAATFWADHQIGPHALQSLMGWAQLSTAQHYLTSSGERTAAAMRDVVM